MLIGILQTGRAPDSLDPALGDYPDMFTRLLADEGFTFRIYKVLEGELPQTPADCDGWLITGSRFGVYEDHAFIKPMEDFIRSAFAARIPVVGICFGHQLMAQAMGGRVEKYDGGWSVGPTEYQFDTGPVVLNAWHQDQVVDLPPTAKVIGRNAFCDNAALLYDDVGLSIQAHPEFSREVIQGLMTTRGRGVVPDDRLDRAEAQLDRPLDRVPLAKRIAAFFRQSRA